MKKLWIGAILSVVFACGIFAYTEWDKRRFDDSLPHPPVVKKIVDIHTHPHPHEHPHPHADSVTATDASAVEVDSEPGVEENTVSASAEQMSEEGIPQIDEAEHTNGVEQSNAPWLTDDEHEHQNTQDPFGKKRKRIEDMDPDELAEMTYTGLLRRFGDIPEVHTFMALERKKLNNEKLTRDELIDFMRAQYHLWPDPRTKKSLETILEQRSTEVSK